ncbi:YbaN family protein [Alphaproteobacteria bacterium KMM 3653]|uniref:YbaN family protein n=1 Tax=Harenicola maris TaxID=2841044 RepID=A0AAP2G8N5_9RHOB|nr:YbaN family protein [Harenicola maris]
MKPIWAICGGLALLLGTLGIPLPLLPTVPFYLLAAFCFAQSSPRLHKWLLEHKTFGPPIREWNERGSITRRAKILATISMAVAIAISIALGFSWRVIGLQVTVMAAVMLFIWTRPEA